MSIRGLILSLLACVVACDGKSSSEATSNSDAAVCPSRSGDFACGTNVCSRATQACTIEQGVPTPTGPLTEYQCSWYGDGTSIPAECSPCPTCACLNASSLNVATCTDDGAGGVTYSLYAGVPGDPCKGAADCQTTICENGSCNCVVAGGPAPTNPSVCCSSQSLQPGDAGYICWAAVDWGCKVGSDDCFGGTCAADGGAFGLCACVGARGSNCAADTDCCAGATKCVFYQCQ